MRLKKKQLIPLENSTNIFMQFAKIRVFWNK